MIGFYDEGAVRVLTFAFPPVNALSVTKGFVPALRSAVADASASDATAIVIRSSLSLFSAGADIADFDAGPEAVNQLRALFNEIEACPKPVIAAISGKALGGGLELALACHYRVADKRAQFAFPEITLGLLPGGGGTQRLPRLIGGPAARELILSGRMIGCEEAMNLGLVDAQVDPGSISDFVDFAAQVAGKPLRATLSRTSPEDDAPGRAIKPIGTSEARSAIERCLLAARQLDGVQGLKVEADEFDALAAGAPSRGLRHVFFGSREVAIVPDLSPEAAPRPVSSVGIVGAGVMGRGIALACVNAGLKVAMVESAEAARDSARSVIEKTIVRDVEKGRRTQTEAEALVASLTFHPGVEALADVDLVIEAVYENLEAKRSVFVALDKVVRPDAILATNTSTLDIDAIGSVLADPSRCVGLHFFSPANIMKLLEVVRGDQTGSIALATAMAFAKAIGKVGVVARSCDGFIGNRMFEEYLRQAYMLLEEGALPAQIDSALEAWGMAMGPLKVMDLAGQDIGWAIRKRRMVEQPERPYSRIPDLICEQGRFGQKAGAGFYLYPDGRTAVSDPEIDTLIETYSKENGIERRSIEDAEIVDRCVLALANEGAQILAEGIASRPVDIDMVYVFGYGFPQERGGPMFYAQEQGRDRVHQRISEFSRGRHGWAWEPAHWKAAETVGA